MTTPSQFSARTLEKWLLVLFVFSLLFLNPWIRGDGVGYYAFARAPLIQHNLDFDADYRQANASFRNPRLDQAGQPKPSFRTATGHLDNHFSVGPAILWTPFLLLAHAGVLVARALGSTVAADGFSAPYRIAMAFATALYGFLALLLSFRIARNFFSETWAFLASLGIWWASSLPVYMYFNPSWSHAHSAFVVTLFLWYWHRTLAERTLSQWICLAVLAGLMLNVYYPNAMLLAVLPVEALRQYRGAFRGGGPSVSSLVARHFVFGFVVVLCLLPTFITRWIVYGGPFQSGYTPVSEWAWKSPYFLAVLFSSNHGLLAWTPVLVFSVLGVFLFCWREPRVGLPVLAAAAAFYFFIACYPDWAGISSFGNRFFVSLTPIFVLGLAAFLDSVSRLFSRPRITLAAASATLTILILWNAGLMFQWGTHLIPARGAISWGEMVHNQFYVVPRQLATDVRVYLFRRKDLMHQIEDQELQQLKNRP